MAEGTHDDAETLVLSAAAAGCVAPDDVLPRLQAPGFGEYAARALRAHFLDAERTGHTGHGLLRIPWLETLPGLDPAARPERVVAKDGYERWEGRGTVGYLVLEAIVRAQLADPPVHARVIAASDCFPTGMLGHLEPIPVGVTRGLVAKSSLSSDEGGDDGSRKQRRWVAAVGLVVAADRAAVAGATGASFGLSSAARA